MSSTDTILATLEQDGVAMLPRFVSDQDLHAMQVCFDNELKNPRWNTNSGYQQNEKWRLLVEDVLALDPAFLSLAINPVVQKVFNQYLGKGYVLSEARGWETIATKREFHGWHNDAWYDYDAVTERPRELKLGFYLTDVETGYFEYVRGSHKLDGRPRHWSKKEVAGMASGIIKMKGKAGQAFIFDTAGIHRQSSPVLTPRRALLYTYHDPKVPIQQEDRIFGRYHSLLLRAAFIGNLTPEERRILGIGSTDYFQRLARPRSRYPLLQSAIKNVMKARLEWQDIAREVKEKKNGIIRRLKRS